MTEHEQQRIQEQEYESVSEQSDQILSHMQDRFEYLMKQDIKDAIAVGDEYLEWLRQDPDEVFLYFNENELKEDYQSRL